VSAVQVQKPLPNKRVITGTGLNGKSTLLEVAPIAATVFEDPHRTGDSPWVSELWVIDRVPTQAVMAGPTSWSYQIEPPRGGAVFRIAQIPPDPVGGPKDQPELRFGMHETQTVDCLVILSGRIRLIMEDGQVELEPGDTVIQQATKHAWSNPGPEPCVMCAVLMSTKQPDS
jgi:mannose-6-phosphate isomerase-like protein (cupin superfamily)